MTALPLLIPVELQSDPDIATAYDLCLSVESSLQQTVNAGKCVGKDLIFARIVGYLIHFSPSKEGRKNVASEINSCKGEQSKLLAIGQRYYDYYIRAFRANKDWTPTPSGHSSRPSFDTLADMLKDALMPATPSNATAKRRALVRDNYRCVLTAEYDYGSWKEIRELRESHFPETDIVPKTLTECAHILPQFTNIDIARGSAKESYARLVWAVLAQFGYASVLDELNGLKVHRLENVMTMDRTLHGFFNNMDIWLVATGNENEYKVESADPAITSRCHKIVTFTTPDPDNLPVPSPAYLAIHAACAKVAHLSGAADSIDKFNRDMEDGRTLHPDGTSVGLLEEAMRGLQVAGY